jgi:hypothetical protein
VTGAASNRVSIGMQITGTVRCVQTPSNTTIRFFSEAGCWARQATLIDGEAITVAMT